MVMLKKRDNLRKSACVIATFLFACAGLRTACAQITMDLHTHSYCSDGIKSPEEMVQEAKNLGVEYYALTDHDTTACVLRAQKKAQELGIRFIRGLEISAEDDSVHILGLGVDPDNSSLVTLTRNSRAERIRRMHAILSKLTGAGVVVNLKEDVLLRKINLERRVDGKDPLTAEDVRRMEEDELLGAIRGQIVRPDIARVLVEKKYVASVREAFDKYLGDGKIGDDLMRGPSAAKVIELIHQAGGIAVLAHPFTIYKFKKFPTTYSSGEYGDFESFATDLIKAGLDGFEIYKTDARFTKDDMDRVVPIIEKYKQEFKSGKQFFLTPGSDYHGGKESGIGPAAMGGVSMPTDDIRRLVDALAP